MFRIAVGRLPFVAKEPTEYLPLHLYKKPPALGDAVPGTPAELEQLYEMLLEKIAAKRVTADEALAFLRAKVRPALNLPPKGGAAVGEGTPGSGALPPMPELPAVPELPTTPPLPQLPGQDDGAAPEDGPRKGRSSDRLIARPKTLNHGGGSNTGLKVAVALAVVGALVVVTLVGLAAADVTYIPFLSDLFHGE